MKLKLRDYQRNCVTACTEYLESKRKDPVLAVLPVGCHTKGYGIKMYDGSVKKVEDVKVGDQLMGNDSTPRNVLKLINGVGNIYKITPNKLSKPFYINEDHILFLEATTVKPREEKTYPKTVEIKLKDYLEWAKSRKAVYKLKRVGIDYNSRASLPVDPYFLGLWLGDGHSTNCSITTMEPEVKMFLKQFADEQDLNYSEKLKYDNKRGKSVKQKAVTVKITKKSGQGKKNHLLEKLRDINVIENKHIPACYKYANLETRIELLSGILDSDGYYSEKNNSVEISFSNKTLADDVCEMLNSIGLFCTSKERTTVCTNCVDKSPRTSYRILYTPLEILKPKVARRKCKINKSKVDRSRVGFKVEYVGEDHFFGFNLDGNNLYLDWQNFIHHNSGKSLIISELARLSKEPVLVLQPRIELLNQNYEKLINLGGTATIYSAGAGSKEISKLTYATLGSVKKVVEELDVGLVILDEAHDTLNPDANSEFMKFIRVLKPKKCIGFTATPFRTKPVGREMQVNMLNRMRPRYFKDIIYILQVSEVIKKRYWAKCLYQEFAFDETKLEFNSNATDFSDRSIESVIKKQGINEAIVQRTKKALKKGATSILVFASSLGSAELIKNSIGKDAEVISSKTPKKKRKQLIEDYKAKKIKVMVNYGILSVGFDYPDLQVVIMGRPTNSLSVYYQIFGRGVRNNTGKEQFVFIDFCGNVKRLGKIETLEIIDYPNWGWGCFLDGVIKTNTPLGYAPITKENIDTNTRYESGEVMPFGKYKGVDLAEIPSHYFKWLLYKSNIQLDSKLRKNIENLIKQI